MKTSIFNLIIPKEFQLVVDINTSVRYENTDSDYEHQPPFFQLNLYKIDSITEQKGETFLDKFICWTEGFRTEVVSSEKTTFKNYVAYSLHTKTDTIFQNEHYKVNYWDVCILLDDTWCVNFRAVYETVHEAIYQSLAQNVYNSIEILGTVDNWEQAYEDDLKQELEAHRASLEEMTSVTINEIEENEIETKPFEIPKDGKEHIKIGDFDFNFIEAECKWNTYVDEEFHVKIKAKTTQVKEAKKAGLLEDHYRLEEGEIELSFACLEIFKNGVPTGKFTFKESRTAAPQYIRFDKDGIDYLDFYGTVTMCDGWLGINGVFKEMYQDNPCFSVSVCKKMSTTNIDWSLYQFTLDEAIQAKPEIVQQLRISKHYKSTFPEEVLSFKNLKALEINHFEENVKALKEIPEEISALKHLTYLKISNTSVEKLPESIGELHNLEQIRVSNNLLKTLPESIFKLPNLWYLEVDENEITDIPSAINLPALTDADFSYNKISTLPESLALQPQLSQLDLNGNPLESLPEAFNTIANLKMNISDKNRLLNYGYQGADGKGTIVWDNTMYLAKNDEKLHTCFLDAIKNTALEKYQTPLEKLALKAVCINTTDADDYSVIGNTRFGGLPDLPQGESYPSYHRKHDEEEMECHYVFIAQLNCEELAPFQDYLPRTGILYFYIDDIESFNCKVVYHPEVTNLQSAQHINVNDLDILDMEEPYNPFKITASAFVALPSFYCDEYWYKLAEAPELEKLEDDDDFSEERDTLSKKLGKKGVYQEWNDTYCLDKHHSINDYIVTQNESPQEQAAHRLKGNPEDWIMLLKVSSDNNCGFCFWDAGDLFFLIHKSDLAKGDFSNVYAGIESS